MEDLNPNDPLTSYDFNHKQDAFPRKGSSFFCCFFEIQFLIFWHPSYTHTLPPSMLYILEDFLLKYFIFKCAHITLPIPITKKNPFRGECITKTNIFTENCKRCFKMSYAARSFFVKRQKQQQNVSMPLPIIYCGSLLSCCFFFKSFIPKICVTIVCKIALAFFQRKRSTVGRSTHQ